jgi:hypothetical protein
VQRAEGVEADAREFLRVLGAGGEDLCAHIG